MHVLALSETECLVSYTKNRDSYSKKNAALSGMPREIKITHHIGNMAKRTVVTTEQCGIKLASGYEIKFTNRMVCMPS